MSRPSPLETLVQIALQQRWTASPRRDSLAEVPPCHLTQLPVDILYLVACYLPCSTLSAASRTCKALRLVLLPEMYRRPISVQTSTAFASLRMRAAEVRMLDAREEMASVKREIEDSTSEVVIATAEKLRIFPNLAQLYVFDLKGHPRTVHDQELDRHEPGDEELVLERVREWIHTYPQFATLHTLGLPPKCGLEPLRAVLGACHKLAKLDLMRSKHHGGTGLPDTARVLDVVLECVGPTLQYLSLLVRVASYDDDEPDVFSPSIGDVSRCPALRSLYVEFWSFNRWRHCNFRRLGLDLHQAKAQNPKWCLHLPDKMVLNPMTLALLSQEEYSQLTRTLRDTRTQALMPKEGGIIVVWRLELALTVLRKNVSVLPKLGPISLCYRSFPYPGEMQHDLSQLNLEALCFECYTLRRPHVNQDAVRTMRERHAWMSTFLSKCRTLTKFTARFPWSTNLSKSDFSVSSDARPICILGSALLKPALSTLCRHHNLVHLHLDMRALLRGGEATLDDLTSEINHYTLTEHVRGVDEVRWVGETGVMPNLRSLVLGNLYILSARDREWFYGLPRALRELQSLSVEGLCWDPSTGTAEEQGEQNSDAVLLKAALLNNAYGIGFEKDHDTHPDCCETINRHLRQRRVEERIKNGLQKVAVEYGGNTRQLEVAIERLSISFLDLGHYAGQLRAEENFTCEFDIPKADELHMQACSQLPGPLSPCWAPEMKSGNMQQQR